MDNLSQKKCVPCSEGTPPLKGEELKKLLGQLEGWELAEDRKIVKEFKFKNFKEALAFVNKVGELAEKEGHHPDIFLGWGKVKISLTTHKIKGLSESDFIFAAKCDMLPSL